MSVPGILAFAGSLRRDSFNRRLLGNAVAAAEGAGGTVTVLDFADLPLPLFDQDAEQRDGLPPNARRLKDLMIAHQGFLIACPEYNSSITPLLKNALDWASRQDGDESGTLPYRNKVAALVAASGGRLGGMRALRHVRDVLTTLGVTVLPEQFTLPAADQAFDADGRLVEERTRRGVHKVSARLVHVLQRWGN